MIATLRIPGEPVAWGRARINPRHGKLITPKRYRAWKTRAADELALAWGSRPALEGPVMLAVAAYWPRPKAMRSGGREPRPSVPDADNVAKAVMDAANGILFADDRQVVALECRKWYAATGDEARVEVVVGPAAGIGSDCGAVA